MSLTIPFVEILDSGEEVTHALPAKFVVCTRCRGTGSHVNPSIDGNGLSIDVFHDDPDFAEAYFSGAYDVQCTQCNGLRVVPVVDEERCKPALLEAYHRQEEEQSRYEAQCAAEQRAEQGYYA